MIITDPNQIDLTGEKSSYKRNLRRFKIFTANQLVDLQDAAYLNTLKVFKVTGYNSSNQPELVELNRGNYANQWYFNDSNKDITAMAKAKIRYDYESLKYLPTIDSSFISGKTYYTKNYVSTGEYEDEDGTFDYVVYSSYTVNTQIPTDLKLYEKDKSVWDYTLVHSFYMGDSHTDLLASGEYEIAVTYQALELECTAIKRDGLGPEYSPGLMRSILDKVEELYYVRNPISNTTASSISDMYCLEEDLTGVKPENYITGEIHLVDVPNSRFVIRPQCGSFYNSDNLVLIFQGFESGGSSTTLIKDEDYVVTGINTEKTAISDPNCGVYEYIVLKKSYVGKIYLSYQAFGGVVTQADINRLKDVVQDIYHVVFSSDIVTVNSLPKTSIIKELIYRQQLIEHTIGHYQSQRFKYTTSTTEKYVNIAFVDRNPWTADAPVPTSCVGEFRIAIPMVDFYMDIKVNYDLNAVNPFSVSVQNIDIPSFEKNLFNYFKMRLFPKFRIIWCSENWTEDTVVHPASDRGVMLQMSLTSLEPISLDVLVEDVTGAKSPWDLVDTRGEFRPSSTVDSIEHYTNSAVRYGKYSENNQGVRTYVFDWRKSLDHTSNIVSIYPHGYTIFAGSIPIDLIETVSIEYNDLNGEVPTDINGYSLTPCIVGSDISLSKVKSVEFKVFDSLTEKFIVGRSERTISNDNNLVAEAIYFLDDLCMISCVITHNNEYSMKVFSRTGTNSLNNKRFSLVQIDLIG